MLFKIKIILFLIITSLILFTQISCDKKDRTGTNAMGAIDTIAYETEKLDRLVLTRDTILIQNQIIKLYDLLEKRVNAEKKEKRLKLLSPKFKKMVQELKPQVEKIKRNRYK